MPKKPANVNLDPDMMAWLKAQAVAKRCSMSQVLRDMVIEAMQKVPTKASKK